MSAGENSVTGALLARLFAAFFGISLTVIGGGYAILAVADRVFAAARYRWTKEGEIVGALPVIQTVPGLIAGNTAVYVGHKVAGRLGAIVALAGVALPSFIVFLVVSICLPHLDTGTPLVSAALLGCRSALTGILAATFLRAARKNAVGAFGLALATGSAAAVLLLKANPAVVIATAMAAGIIRNLCLSHGRPTAVAGLGAIPLLFLQYGVLCFGGGYVLVPFYLDRFVGADAPLLQIPVEQFSNVMALTQVTPGPISVNAATFFGYCLGGLPGAALATACLLLPSLVLMTLAVESLDRWHENRFVRGILEGARPASVGLLLAALHAFAGMSVWNAGIFSPTGAILTCVTAFAFARTHLAPAVLILGSAGLTVLLESVAG